MHEPKPKIINYMHLWIDTIGIFRKGKKIQQLLNVTISFLVFSVNNSIRTLLTLSLLMTTQEDFLDSVDQDQTAQNVQSDLWSTLFTLFFFFRL